MASFEEHLVQLEIFSDCVIDVSQRTAFYDWLESQDVDVDGLGEETCPNGLMIYVR